MLFPLIIEERSLSYRFGSIFFDTVLDLESGNKHNCVTENCKRKLQLFSIIFLENQEKKFQLEI